MTPELVLPVGRTVRFDLVSDDVNHSFWCRSSPEATIPGVDNEIDIEVTEPASGWAAPSTAASTTGRWTSDVRAIPADEFDAWLAEQRRR